jgi:tetratricopeptide (TPR) repeat protein
MTAVSAEESKSLGNTALKEGRLQAAVDHYGDAIKQDPANHIYYSNRSAAFTKLEEYRSACADGQKCIELKPNWVRGHSRKACALHLDGQYEEAILAYKAGLSVGAGDPGLQLGLRKAQAAAAASGGAASLDPQRGVGRKPQVDRRRLAVVVMVSMVLGQVCYHYSGRGFPMLWTMAFTGLGVQFGLVPVNQAQAVKSS